MPKIFRFIALAVLAMAVPALQAGSIDYSVAIGCGDTCVSVYLEWQNESPGISYVEIDDNFGDFLFGLTTAPFPETTGAILPDPQTVSGLSSDVISLIDAGGPTTASLNAESGGTGPGKTPATSAILVLEDQEHQVVAEEPFDVAGSSTPEPAAWSLTGAGLGLLFAWSARRRKLRTGTDATTPE